MPLPALIVPRVYLDDRTLVAGTSGILRGDFIGLSFRPTSTFAETDGFSSVASGFLSEGGYLTIERREFARPDGPADLTPRIVADRIYLRETTGSVGAYSPAASGGIVLFTDTDGRLVLATDNLLEDNVEYEYRAVLTNRWGNRMSSRWTP